MLPDAFKCSAPVRALPATSFRLYQQGMVCIAVLMVLRIIVGREKASAIRSTQASLCAAKLASKGGLQLVEHSVDTAQKTMILDKDDVSQHLL